LFLGYIHYFRALAIFFIIAGHSIDAFVWAGNESVERILRIYMSNGSVLFVFIAGYLFQHLSVKYEVGKYYIFKLKNVLAPYLLISIPAIFVFTHILERDIVWSGFYDNPIWVQIGLFYLTGKHLAPLWFIPMIAIFYIIAPLLMKADRGTLIYFLLPVFISISCFFGRGELPYENFIHFFSVYLLGMACSKYKYKLNPFISKYIFLCISFAIVILFGALELFFMEGTMTYINYLQKITMSIFFLGLFYKFNSALESGLVSVVANTSFGVFFIHSYFLTGNKLVYTSLFNELPQGNLLIYSLTVIVTLFACVLFITFIKKITGNKSKYFVGS